MPEHTPTQVFPAGDTPQDPGLERELLRAREVQARLLPAALPTIPGFDVAAAYLPAAQVGGDYYDLLPLPGRRFGIVMADVSGKSISAALIMVLARTVFHTVAAAGADARATVLRANDLIAPDLPPGNFLTVTYAILDPARASLSLVCCGHPPPLLFTDDSDRLSVGPLPARGPAIGLVRGPTFERALVEHRASLPPASHLLFHTDGVSEAMDLNGRLFGDQELGRAVLRAGHRDADGMAHEIVNAVLHHRGIAPPSDDITVLDVWRLP